MKTEEAFAKLNDRMDTIDSTLHEANKNLAVYNTHLEHHIKRTEMVESRLELFEDEIKPALDAYKFIAILIKLLLPISAVIGLYLKYKD